RRERHVHRRRARRAHRARPDASRRGARLRRLAPHARRRHRQRRRPAHRSTRHRAMNASWSLRTPPGVGAIAAVDLLGDVDGALAALRIAPVAVGEARLRDLAGVDRGMVARWTDSACTLVPHGGTAVVRALTGALHAAGIGAAKPDPIADYPEAACPVEAFALSAIAACESPRAIDLLLDQPRRWREWRGVRDIDT